MTFEDVTFRSEGVACSAWHFRGNGEAFAGPGGRPIVVMAHGFGGTKDAGLQPFAERISAAGIDVLAFDYRGFGASDGQPRQSISVKRQIQDYYAAVDTAKGLPGVDGSRVAIWGSSMSGSHVFHVAADRPDVAAVIAMTPLTSGVAAARASAGSRGVLSAVRWMALGVASRVSVARGRGAKLMPLVARPGEPGANGGSHVAQRDRRRRGVRDGRDPNHRRCQTTAVSATRPDRRLRQVRAGGLRRQDRRARQGRSAPLPV